MEEQHKNRRGLLIGVGIVELLFAAFLLLMLLLMGFSFVMTLFLDQSKQLYPAGSVAYVIIIYGGIIKAVMTVFLVIFFVYLLFKKRKAGWIGSLALYSFFSLTTIVTIISKGLSAYYQDVGMYVPPPAELELIDSMFASLERALPAFMFIYFALFTGLFLWAGKQLWDHEETEV